MSENDFEKQVEREEAAYTEPEQAEQAASGAVSDVVERVKELVKKGNVTKIVIKKNDNILVNIPLNVGIVGSIIGVAAAPWAVIAAAVATAGFACRVEIVKEDGEILEVNSRAVEDTAKDFGEKAKDFGKDFGEKAKDLGKDFGDIARDFGERAKDVGEAVIDGIKDAVAGEQAEDADFEAVVEEAEEAAGDPGPEE